MYPKGVFEGHHIKPYSLKLFSLLWSWKGFPGGSDGTEFACNAGGLEDPLEEGMATHSSILAWRNHEHRSLVGYSPWGLKELDMTE